MLRLTHSSCRVMCGLAVLIGAGQGRALGDANAWQSAPAVPGAKVVLAVATASDENPHQAGKTAAAALKQKMGDAPLRAVIVSESFEDRPNKEQLLAGVCSVLPKEIVLGQATYGSFTQSGCTDFDSVCLLGIGGQGIGVAAALVTDLGAANLTYDENREVLQPRLRAAGTSLAGMLARTRQDRLLLLMADAHSPKNQPLVEGLQQVLGKQFPVTGGCANKNAGQTFVFFRGQPHADAAVAVMLSGDFHVSLAGRQGKDNDAVIATAGQAASQALAGTKGNPLAALAFNCAGRRSKLKSPADELAAIQKVLGVGLPLFGCYCAGEIGPLDPEVKQGDALSGGTGWHVMFTILSRE